MTNKLQYRQDFSVTINDNEYRLSCYYQKTRTGFRHLCFLTSMCEGGEPSTKDYLAKCTYINRTWECFPYASVLREAVNKIVTSQVTNTVNLALDTVRRVN